MIRVIQGTCRGCGQVQNINVGDLDGLSEEKLQEAADDRATRTCGCPEGREYGNWENTKDLIRAICGPESRRAGFDEISEETELELIKAARMVFDGLVDKITISVDGSQIIMTATEDGARITRKATLEIGG